jgi:hypothetical protein
VSVRYMMKIYLNLKHTKNKMKGKTKMKTTTETQTNIKSLFIEARLWFDKTHGNTYHSVRLEADGLSIGQVPMTYGYGEHYEQTAIEYLRKVGLVSPDVRYISELKRNGVTVYIAASNRKKSELHKALKINQNFSNLLHIEEIKKGN